MAEDVRARADGIPPQAQLMQMAMGFMMSDLLGTAVKLGLADHLADGPKTAEELARPTGTHAPTLYRLLRTLSSHGLFAEDSERRFALTALSEPLRTGVPGSVKTSVQMITGDFFKGTFANLTHSVETGKTAFEKKFGANLFEYLSTRPEDALMFSDLMVRFHGPETAAVAAAYDFSGVGTIADVGGATGNMITTILAKNPAMTGLIYDLPHNEAVAAALVGSRGMSERVKFEVGNFFESVPAGYDAYLMSHIIHDWNEEQCLTILRNCRRAMGPKSRLLIVEFVLPTGNVFHPGKMTDMIMLTIPGGEERTEQQYRELLAKAGFRLERVVRTESAASVVEAYLV
jgi:O-methyltransferase domain/Dimerisation domain